MSHDNLRVQVDDNPPPPYSETDIYSVSGGIQSPDASTSSNAGQVIYTPPLTPRSSRTGHTASSIQQARPLPIQPGAAALYFESRPAPSSPAGWPRGILFHTVQVQDGSLPDDLPYQDDLADRDVTLQDWATFVNFLLPDHAARGNEVVFERKLREEGRSDTTSTDGRSQAEAQLQHMRESQAPAARSRRDIEATIQQWNDGFFGPRGITVRLDPDTDARMPGAWESRPDFFGASRWTGHQWSRPDALSWSSRGWGHLENPHGHGFGRRDLHDVHHEVGWRVRHHLLDHHHRHDVGQSSSWHRRQRSSSVSSSDSSDSSSSSESSIGSLPGHDEVQDDQLALYAERLLYWTSSPDHVRTKSDVKALKAELKSGAVTSRTMATSKDSYDKPALKAQIKALHAQWKSIKRAQKQTRKANQRERRQRRRAEKKEHRRQKREMKKAYKDLRRRSAGLPGGMVAPMNASGYPPIPPEHAADPAGAPSWNRGFSRGFSRSHHGPPPRHPLSFGAEWLSRGRDPSGVHGPFGGRGFTRGGRVGRCRSRGGPLSGFKSGLFGADRGRGSPRDAPGAWPDDDDDDGQAAHAVTQPEDAAQMAEYSTVEQIEQKLTRLRAQTADLDTAKVDVALEKEIEALSARLNMVRMAADEAYARDLAMREA